MIHRLYTKTVIGTIIASLLIPSAFLFYPYKAEAAGATCASVVAGAVAGVIGISAATKIFAVPVGDPGTQAGTIVGAGAQYGTFFKDCILKPLAIKLANAMLHNLTSSILTWINSGFHGNPSFVTNLKGLIDDTTDQAIGQFIEDDLGAGFLCSSFSFQVKLAVAQTYLPYRQRSSCTLKDISRNVNGFIANDNNGGWNNWLDVTTVPQNNYWGATVLAQDELSKKVIDVQARTKDVLGWSNGFRAWEVCTIVIDPETGQNTGEDPNMAITDSRCKQHESRTPGIAVEKMLESTLGTDVRKLELADDLDAIAGALVDQLTLKVITGAQGLLGAGKKSNGSSGATSYTQALNPTIDPSLSTAINAGVNQTIEDNNIDSLFTVPDSSSNSVPNLALGANASSASTDLASNAAFATDGNPATVFTSTSDANPSIIIDLGSVQPFSSITITGVNPVSSSLGTLHVTAYNVPGSSPVMTQDVTAMNNPVTISVSSAARYISIEKTTGPLQIAEVEVAPGNSSSNPTNSTANVSWQIKQLTPTVTAATPLAYETDLTTDTATSSITVITRLKKDGVPVPFLSVFSSVRITFGTANGSLSNQNITSTSDSGVRFPNISIFPNGGFVVKYQAYRQQSRSGAYGGTGTYTIVTTAEYPNGTVFATQSNDFVVQ